MPITQYDFQKANQRVQELYAEYADVAPALTMLPADWVKVYNSESPVSCSAYGTPTSYRLVERISEADGTVHNEELVFRVIGIIDDVDLPPFRTRVIRQTQLSYLQQRVKIIAPTSTSHGANIRAISEILDKVVTKLSPLQTDTHGCIAARDKPIAFTNRMFTPIDYTRKQSPAMITNAMDPLHALRRAAEQQEMIHTDENTVEYLARDKFGYKLTTPTSFNRGDIAEVHFSIVLFHCGQERLFAKLILRGITNLDSSFSQAYRMQQISVSSADDSNENNGITLKRKCIEEHERHRRQTLTDVTNVQEHKQSIPVDQTSDQDTEMSENIRSVRNGLEDLALRP